MSKLEGHDEHNGHFRSVVFVAAADDDVAVDDDVVAVPDVVVAGTRTVALQVARQREPCPLSLNVETMYKMILEPLTLKASKLLTLAAFKIFTWLLRDQFSNKRVPVTKIGSSPGSRILMRPVLKSTFSCTFSDHHFLISGERD